jgi:hypothetical protein
VDVCRPVRRERITPHEIVHDRVDALTQSVLAAPEGVPETGKSRCSTGVGRGGDGRRRGGGRLLPPAHTVSFPSR